MSSNGFQSGLPGEKSPPWDSSDSADVAVDPASSSFFNLGSTVKVHDDLASMLDGNKDHLKLEAMKRIITMVAKGKDASDLFPAVVKNVVSKNIEVKKLVYVYLSRYAEEQQDLALLSISTFQRALKDPNQLIRASALRVLSSIRVPMIVPIMMLAIKDSVRDMSPYVRKTAAHAIPKMFSLDPEQKDSLIEVIEKLLADKTTLVAGSAIQAFEEVCPERIDLIHKNYRKLCNLLVDVEEWGQVVIINMLTRYCRSQFVSPNQFVKDEKDENFYASEDSDNSSKETSQPKSYIMDQDHRLLLKNCKPLLNSRNAAVVMGVAQLYYHCAPKAEVIIVVRALIRLLRSHREVQFVVLSNIATISISNKGLFEPYLKSFYVRSNDPTQNKLLKLEILTNLATETNISTILREFQTYVTSADKEFAASTIQAIGRCASSIREITDTCLNGLVGLLSNRDEAVVGESVVVIKKLLQMQPSEHYEIIVHLAKLVDNITAPMARASILWLIGEYSVRVPKIAPDVLRKTAKTFINEEDIVKLQILNLAAKLCIINSKQTKLLAQYVFNLAKYDPNYDIRDRARFMRQLILPQDKSSETQSNLSKYVKKIFLATKPAPVLESKFKERNSYQLGTLSHVLDTRANEYQELVEWPTVAPDPSVRNVEVPSPWSDSPARSVKKKHEKKKSFYSEDETEEESSSGEEQTSSSGESSEGESGSEDSESDSNSDEYTSSESNDSEIQAKFKQQQEVKSNLRNAIKQTEQLNVNGQYNEIGEESSDESSSEFSDESSDQSDESVPDHKAPSKPEKEITRVTKSEKTPASKKPVENLLDLDDFGPSVTPMNLPPPSNQFLMPTALTSTKSEPPKQKTQPNYNIMDPVITTSKSYELLNRITGNGLQAEYKFTRNVSIFSPKMVSIELMFTNTSDKVIDTISVGHKKLQPGMELNEFPQINSLPGGGSTSVLCGINFNDTTQPAQFEIVANQRKFNVSITAPVGELLQPNTLIDNDFNKLKGKLTGMNESCCTVNVPHGDLSAKAVCKSVYQAANMLRVTSEDENLHKFASQTISNNIDTLLTVQVLDKKVTLTTNCEKMVIGSMLLKDVKKSLTASS